MSLWVALSMAQMVGRRGCGDVRLIWIILISPEDLDAILLWHAPFYALLLHYDLLCTVVTIFPSNLCNFCVCC